MQNYKIDSYTVVKEENIPILRKYMLNYLGVKGHDMCNLPSNCSGKNIYRERERLNGIKY